MIPNECLQYLPDLVEFAIFLIEKNRTKLRMPNQGYGLIGYPLSHSFSKQYFADKFEKEGIADATYENYSLEDIEMLPALLSASPEIRGLNVTIPYKEKVIPFLDRLEGEAEEIQAVNTIVVAPSGELIGYNSDIHGFRTSLRKFLPASFEGRALILGSGGASKAVEFVLRKQNIGYQYVSRSKGEGLLTYDEVDQKVLAQHSLIINTTPLGMSPKTALCPALPYQYLTPQHWLYDLIYNPPQTRFMKLGEGRGAQTKNGLEMLILQAEKSWDIWNQTRP